MENAWLTATLGFGTSVVTLAAALIPLIGRPHRSKTALRRLNDAIASGASQQLEIRLRAELLSYSIAARGHTWQWFLTILLWVVAWSYLPLDGLFVQGNSLFRVLAVVLVMGFAAWMATEMIVHVIHSETRRRAVVESLASGGVAQYRTDGGLTLPGHVVTTGWKQWPWGVFVSGWIACSLGNWGLMTVSDISDFKSMGYLFIGGGLISGLHTARDILECWNRIPETNVVPVYLRLEDSHDNGLSRFRV